MCFGTSGQPLTAKFLGDPLWKTMAEGNGRSRRDFLLKEMVRRQERPEVESNGKPLNRKIAIVVPKCYRLPEF
jgi:hypothetical protein